MLQVQPQISPVASGWQHANVQWKNKQCFVLEQHFNMFSIFSIFSYKVTSSGYNVTHGHIIAIQEPEVS